MVNRISTCIALMLMASGCLVSNREGVNWKYIVPVDYVGWVAIQYDCPDGVPLPRRGNTITVEFNADGFFCTSESEVAWRGKLNVYHQNGDQLPNNWPGVDSGYGYCCGGSGRYHSTENGQGIYDVILERTWIGYIGEVNPTYSLKVISEQAHTGEFIPKEW
jgi:hypothetical protein